MYQLPTYQVLWLKVLTYVQTYFLHENWKKTFVLGGTQIIQHLILVPKRWSLMILMIFYHKVILCVYTINHF